MKSNQSVAEIGQQLSIESPLQVLDKPFLISGTMLHPLSPEYRFPLPPTEKPFRTVKEVEELLRENRVLLFGEKSILVSPPKKSTELFKDASSINLFLLDMDAGKFYFLNILLGNNFYFLQDVFPRFTSQFLYVIDESNIEVLAKYLCKEAKKDLQKLEMAEDVDMTLKRIIGTATSILTISEKIIPDLSGMKQLYPQPWRKVHAMVFKRFVSNGYNYCSISPTFDELSVQHVKPREKKEKVEFTEADHLEKASDGIKAAYLSLKEELLKIPNVELVPQRYYIAVKRLRNVAFFHLRRSKMDLVVKCHEKEAKKILKKTYATRSLADSVQKFWGGVAVSVVVENSDHLKELVDLLRKVLGE